MELATTLVRAEPVPTVFQFLSSSPSVGGRVGGPRRRVRCGEVSSRASVRREARVLQLKLSSSVSEESSSTLRIFVRPKAAVVRGIDLAARGGEVRKLFFAAFARGLVRDGYDPEEALQEVYRGLLARNAGTCPFDPSKSSFGHYVHIVSRCVLANWIRKERRRAQFETVGVEGEGSPDVGESEDRSNRAVSPREIENLVRRMRTGGPVREAVELLVSGHSKREVLSTLGVEGKWLERVMGEARGLLEG